MKMQEVLDNLYSDVAQMEAFADRLYHQDGRHRVVIRRIDSVSQYNIVPLCDIHRSSNCTVVYSTDRAHVSIAKQMGMLQELYNKYKK